jgi:hypothetical protein
MPDSRLVIPDEIEDLVIGVLRDCHAEHLAKVERVRDKQAETFERFKTISHLSDTDLRVSGDSLPAVLLMVSGTADAPTQNEDGTLDAQLELVAQVTVLGQKKRDTLRRRDVMAWTTIECLLQRVPRGSDGLISEIALLDYEPVAEADTERILADARIVFQLGVASMVRVVGGLPTTATPWPAGGPGGAPPAGAPYTPPLDPPTASSVTFQLEREPIVE